MLSGIATAHGTRLFVEAETRTLRHGDRFSSPDNVRLVSSGETARLVHRTQELEVAIGCTCEPPFEAHSLAGGGGGTAFLVEEMGRGKFALRCGDRYLAAEEDGRVTLSLDRPLAWARFHTLGRIATVAFDGVETRFFIDDPDDYIQDFHVRGQFYELRQLLTHLEAVPLGSVVLDVGANVGNHTLFYSHHSRAGRIYPFEPNPRARELLVANVEMNAGAGALVDLRYAPLALGAGEGKLALASSPQGNLGGASYAPTSESGDIACRALDELTFLGEVGFIKMDVEGMELQVLSGAEAQIARHRPVLYVEVDRRNEGGFWEWLDEHRYEPVGASYHYLTAKNYLLFPRA